jgi:hypothetical protein
MELLMGGGGVNEVGIKVDTIMSSTHKYDFHQQEQNALLCIDTHTNNHDTPIHLLLHRNQFE